MEPIYALTILLVIFVLGEYIAKKTKAILSTTLVIALTLLILFWLGLDPNIIEIAAIDKLGLIMMGILICGMGSMIDFPELKRQWKVVIISLGGAICGVALIAFIGSFFMDSKMALAGAPIFAGANVSTLIVTTALADKGLESLATFCVLILVTQNFIGIPITSFLLKKEAKRFIKSPDAKEYMDIETSTNEETIEKKPLIEETPMLNLAKLGILGCLSFFLSSLTGGVIHYFVIVLLVGIVATKLGFLKKNVLDYTNSASLIIFMTTIIIFANLAKTTPQMIIDLIGPLLIVLFAGVLGVCLAGVILGKILKVSPLLAISLGLTCTFGFPTTMFIPKEVACAVGENEEEETAITNYLLPKMLIAGFVTVTIASVLIAGFVVTLL